MPPRAFARHQIFQQTTGSPWTSHFMHLQPFPRVWTKRSSWADPHLKPAKPADRIKWWNIVPGDQIRLLGENQGGVHEVLSINRLTSRVYLKGATESPADSGRPPIARHVPYAKCQLYLGDFLFPPVEGSGKKEGFNKQVFATRLGTSRPKWDKAKHRWVWKRFAANTFPHLPTNLANKRVSIPWPEPTKPPVATPSAHDTPEDVVTEITYTVPHFPELPTSSLNPPRFAPAPFNEYIRAIKRDEDDQPTDFDTLLTELQLTRELSNPHSRAKKQARWQEKQQYEKDLLKTYLAKAIKGKAGRQRKDARAEAVWRWKEQLAQEAREERRRRWVLRGAQARLEKKQAHRAAKEARRVAQLRDLVLEAAPNQVIPA